MGQCRFTNSPIYSHRLQHHMTFVSGGHQWQVVPIVHCHRFFAQQLSASRAHPTFQTLPAIFQRAVCTLTPHPFQSIHPSVKISIFPPSGGHDCPAVSYLYIPIHSNYNMLTFSCQVQPLRTLLTFASAQKRRKVFDYIQKTSKRTI